ncbi:MAG: TM1812 family CRISPR-associated protein [Phascolarctobacterium sp.]|nr:TM1812 family CRISPR-associated protein [Phascolarctobacterium sp.]
MTRKVFLTSIGLIDDQNPSYCSNDFDFDFEGKKFQFPMSYFVDEYVEDGEEVLLISSYQPNVINGKEQFNASGKQLIAYEKEVEEILKKKDAKYEFVRVETLGHVTGAHALHVFFKKIVKLLQPEDQLYVDFTRGTKPYSFAMFVAAAAAEEIFEDAEIVYSIYCQKYTGNTDFERTAPTNICDITGLNILNSLIGDFRKGQSVEFLKLLDKVIVD